MSGKEKDLTEEDYLKKHLEGLESGSKGKEEQNDTVDNESNASSSNTGRVSDLKYYSFDVKMLPCGKFYPEGTLLMIRPAEVAEIQSYSTVDDDNFYDIVEKMNGMLQSCVRVKYSNGDIGTYLDIKDQDRLYIIFLIRELTFQKGNSLTVKVPSPCGDGDEEMGIELKKDNFVFHEVSEALDKYFIPSSGSYKFNIKNGKSFEIAPPTIGIQKAFSDYIVKETQKNKEAGTGKKLDMSFLKIIPFLLPNRTSISYEGIKSKLKEFKEMDNISFQFVNSAVGKLTFGIKELKKMSECGEEVRTPMKFPSGASSIFVIQDAFESYLEE